MDMAVPNCLHQIRFFQTLQDGGMRAFLIIRGKKEFFHVGDSSLMLIPAL
jgi:hypothetical protein